MLWRRGLYDGKSIKEASKVRAYVAKRRTDKWEEQNILFQVLAVVLSVLVTFELTPENGCPIVTSETY